MTNLVVAGHTGTAGTVTGVRTKLRVVGDLTTYHQKSANHPDFDQGASDGADDIGDIEFNDNFASREPRAVMADSSAVLVR